MSEVEKWKSGKPQNFFWKNMEKSLYNSKKNRTFALGFKNQRFLSHPKTPVNLDEISYKSFNPSAMLLTLNKVQIYLTSVFA